MNDLYNMFFSPISKEYCLYFELLMYLAFLGIIITVIGVIMHAVFSKKKRESILTYLLAIFQSGLYYFVMRLLYSMCIR